MEFIPLVQMAALVFAVINFLKFLRAGDSNGWMTQLIVWVAGLVVVLLTAQTDFASGIPVGDQMLDTLNIASLIFLGLSISSIASFGVEVKKALDGSDSAAKPNLITNNSPPNG